MIISATLCYLRFLMFIMCHLANKVFITDVLPQSFLTRLLSEFFMNLFKTQIYRALFDKIILEKLIFSSSYFDQIIDFLKMFCTRIINLKNVYQTLKSFELPRGLIQKLMTKFTNCSHCTY